MSLEGIGAGNGSNPVIRFGISRDSAIPARRPTSNDFKAECASPAGKRAANTGLDRTGPSDRPTDRRSSIILSSRT